MKRMTIRELSELYDTKLKKMLFAHARFIEAYYRNWPKPFQPVGIDGLMRVVKAMRMKEARRVRTSVRQRRKPAATAPR